jgi:acetyltransferase
MSVRNLHYLFSPRSVALIGASDQPQSVGAVLTANLLSGGFGGPVDLVNPRLRTLGGVRVHRDIADLPEPPDLAVIATPAETVPGIVQHLARGGTRAAVVISAGFAEGGDHEGKTLRQALLDAAQSKLLRINGPNCLGIMVPGVGLNASFAHIHPRRGQIAFVAQSGAVVTSVLDWASARGIGFSHLVSLGNMADVDFGDMLDYLANDSSTHAVLLYIESITSARKFMSAARAAARTKPVIVVKSGRYTEGARAAASHTGALAGLDEVYDAAISRAGMLRVHSLNELFDAVESLARSRLPQGERLAILSNGGGIGVMATDALIEHQGRLARLSPKTIARLDAVLPPTWSRANPVDIIGDAPGSRYAAALKVLLEEPEVDATLVLNCPTAIASGTEAARAVVDESSGRRRATVLTSWVGEEAAAAARRLFTEAGIATYETPEQAVRAFTHMVNYRRNQELLMQTPPSIPAEFEPDPALTRSLAREALAAGRDWLTEPEAKSILTAYGIPCVETRIAETPEAAAQAAATLNFPVAIKILSPDITHKSDVGGVVLDLEDAEAVRTAATAMLQRVQAIHRGARIDGFTIQPMARRPGAQEIILGMFQDAQFGPVLLFGHGGTAVEVINDKALGFPPLNLQLAHAMMQRTRVHRLLQGFRDRPAADLEALALTLVRVSQLVVDVGEIVELDVNPLLVNDQGVIALDARLRVQPSPDHPHRRLAIRPYPQELEEDVPLGDGRSLFLRPIVPEDEPAIQRSFASLTPEEIRLRFFVPIKVLSHVNAARFTQIDYDREMALILTERGGLGQTPIYGVVHITADPDNTRAEYAILIHHDMTGLGLGMFLMRRIIDYARARGIGQLYGDVLADNRAMLKLCSVLGFDQTRPDDNPGIVRVVLSLREPDSDADAPARP